jgi:hypothetical protein
LVDLSKIALAELVRSVQMDILPTSLPTAGQTSHEPDYLTMNLAGPSETQKADRNGKIKSIYGLLEAHIYEELPERAPNCLAASPKAVNHPARQEAKQHRDKSQKNNPVFGFKLRYNVTIAFIFMFIITGELRMLLKYFVLILYP